MNTVRVSIEEKYRFGQLVKAARIKSGITLWALADKLNVCVPYLSGIENAHHLPSLQVYQEMSELIN